jgi:hypothetical protein
MTTFGEREQAFETMFAHDKEMLFRAEARRAKLLAAWACERMGLVGKEADRYVQSFMTSMIQGKGIERLIEKLREDLDGAGATPDIPAIEATVATLTARAAAEVRSEGQAGGKLPEELQEEKGPPGPDPSGLELREA